MFPTGPAVRSLNQLLLNWLNRTSHPLGSQIQRLAILFTKPTFPSSPHSCFAHHLLRGQWSLTVGGRPGQVQSVSGPVFPLQFSD